MPKWLYRSAETDRIFLDELVRTIKDSRRYKPLQLGIPTLSISTPAAAKAFREKHDMALLVQHDSPFYSSSKKYMNNVRLLQEEIPFLNAHTVHEIGHSKINTKRLLREHGIPVLDDFVAVSTEGLHSHLQEGKWYVVKPADKGAGIGVKLLKKEDGGLLQYHNGKWCSVDARSRRKDTITITRSLLWSYTYEPMLIEPYFNDDPEGFASLRCTVVGNEIVEAVKRTNRLNITSNVSSGGTAQQTELNDEQKSIVLATAKAMDIDYAGIDLLVCGGKSVIGEVNIGPFTTFSAYTGSPIGRKVAEYAMKKSDESLSLSSLDLNL